MRNAILANELARVLLPTGHAVAVEDPNHSSGESFRRVLGKIEGCLQQQNKTNFTDVCAFNELIGNPMGGADSSQVAKQFALIESEFEELRVAVLAYCQGMDAVKKGDYTAEEVFGAGGHQTGLIEIRDGIADVLVTTYGLAHRMGIDADKDMLAVSASNASKFFNGTEEAAAVTCKALADSLGIVVEMRKAADLGKNGSDGDDWFVWAFVSSDDSDPERPRGKLLKAPGYKPPVFD